MRNSYWDKGLVFGLIVLLIGASVIPGVGIDTDEINCLKGSIKLESYNVITLTFSPIDDTYVRKDYPDNPSGSGTSMIIRNEYGDGGDNSTFECLGLIKFNISSIPSDVIIINATLNLYYFSYDDNNPVGRDLNLYRATSDWDEDTATYNNQPSYSSQPTTNSTVPDNFDWMSWNVTDDIQGFVNGSFDDYGWRIIDENYWGQINIPTTVFYTKEYGDYIPYLEIEAVSPDIVYIDDDFDENTSGWGYNHFDNIQDGVDAVNESGTVFVYNGTYYEYVKVNKQIDLSGEDNNNTIIDGSNSGDVVYISANSVNISGFMIRNGSDVGIDIHSNHSTVLGNNISNNKYGIIFSGYDYGYSGNTITGNIIMNNEGGIYLRKSSSCTITSNNIQDNYVGIFLWNSSHNTIFSNYINLNTYDGIDLQFSSNNNTITGNTIMNNENGIYLEFSSNNTVYHNNLINNVVNAVDEGNNTWDDGYPFGGNYWSDYPYGDDFNGPNQDVPGRDGIGDTPYEIPCEHGTDYYPLMTPDGWIHSPPNIPNKPSGETIILPGMSYTYNTSTIDPDDDSIWFKWDWGDGTFSDWLGPYDSGEEVSSTHIWAQGIHKIRVKAKDSRNPETDWSNSLTVNAIYPNLKTVLLFGFITNRSKSTDYYSFNAEKVLWIGFNPIFPEIYSSNEVFIVSNKYFGILFNSVVFGFFNAMVLT